MRWVKTNPAKWAKFQKTLREIQIWAPNAFQKETVILAQAIKRQVQGIMIEQIGDWTQNARDTKYSKRNPAAPKDFLLVDTMKYYKSIRVTMNMSDSKIAPSAWKMSRANRKAGKQSYTIAPNKRFTVAGNTALSMRDLAYLLENGSSRGMKGRPMWAYMQGRFNDDIQKMGKKMGASLKKQLSIVYRTARWPLKFKETKYNKYPDGTDSTVSRSF